ncbi:hypothetical protein ACFX12_031675 [Malus domestica]
MTSPAMKKIKPTHTSPPTNSDAEPPKQKDEQEEGNEKKPYILQLPNHITVEIFGKIPIKALIQCRCVCKSWRRSLSDPQFTKYLLSQTPDCLLLQNSSTRNPNTTGLFLVDLDKPSGKNDVVIRLPKDPNVPNFGVQIVGSCNGFLCVYDRLNSGRFYISNPVIGESITLPRFPKDIAFPFLYGFGFSPVDGVYKLVVVASTSNGLKSEWEVMVLTVSTGSWRNVGNSVYPFGYQSYGVYHDGFLHWIARSDNSVLICAFDVGSECFQELPLPPCSLGKRLVSLAVLRGCLSVYVLSMSDINVWVMKDYGVKESWVRELVMQQVIGYRTSFSATQLLKFTKKGQVVFLHKYKLRDYTPGKKGSAAVEVDGIPSMVEAFVHIPSFVSLKDAIMDLSSESSCFHLETGDGFLLLDYFELSTVTASDVGGQIVYSMKMAPGR